MTIPLVLIHGYSDQGSSYGAWAKALQARGYTTRDIHVCSYTTLTNEVSLKDIAEGLDRALREEAGLNQGEPFDAVVHSTGMLVLRSWLAGYNQDRRHKRLKHLIALAPGSFGSPLAHKGRSWLGAIVKGNRSWGADFLESGDRILDGLELGSRFTWDLAHVDLLNKDSYFGLGPDTPYVFTFCGTQQFTGIRQLANDPGTDGAVRLAGCPLNTRKITLDLTDSPGLTRKARFQLADWCNQNIPLVPIANINHEDILARPSSALINLVHSALQVNDETTFQAWLSQARNQTRPALQTVGAWQQFVVRMLDERGDPVPDYNLQLFWSPVTDRARESERDMEEFAFDVHTYSQDRSMRCFHVNLANIDLSQPIELRLGIIASSGTELMGYYGYGADSRWSAEYRFPNEIQLPAGGRFTFFYPFTTTLIEIRLNREPLPRVGVNRVFKFNG